MDDSTKKEGSADEKFLPRPSRILTPPKTTSRLGATSMGKKFQFLYCKHYVQAVVEEAGKIVTVNTHFWSGVRTETTFILQGDLNKDLGFLTEEQLAATEGGPTPEKETRHSSAARNGLLYELQFSIKPQSGQTPISPYGDLYTTYLIVSADISFNTAAAAIRKRIFVLGPDSTKYEVVRGSIIQKKSKDTTWRYQA